MLLCDVRPVTKATAGCHRAGLISCHGYQKVLVLRGPPRTRATGFPRASLREATGALGARRGPRSPEAAVTGGCPVGWRSPAPQRSPRGASPYPSRAHSNGGLLATVQLMETPKPREQGEPMDAALPLAQHRFGEGSGPKPGITRQKHIPHSTSG